MVVLKAFTKVFRNGKYILLALAVSVFGFAFATWLPNLGLVFRRILWGESLSERTELPFILLGSIATNFTLFSAATTVLTVILLGVSVAMMVFSFRMRTRGIKSAGLTVGFFGTLSGIIGVGCAACGSIILTPLLAIFGGTTLLALLPLGGGEFALLGIALLLFSLCITSRQIESPAACRIKP